MFFLLLKLYFPLVQGELLLVEHYQLLVGGGVPVGPLGLQLGPGLVGGLFSVFLGGFLRFTTISGGLLGIQHSSALKQPFMSRLRIFILGLMGVEKGLIFLPVGLHRPCRSRVADGAGVGFLINGFLRLLVKRNKRVVLPKFSVNVLPLLSSLGGRCLVKGVGKPQHLPCQLVDSQPRNSELLRQLFYNLLLFDQLLVGQFLGIAISGQRFQKGLDRRVFLLDSLAFRISRLHGLIKLCPAFVDRLHFSADGVEKLLGQGQKDLHGREGYRYHAELGSQAAESPAQFSYRFGHVLHGAGGAVHHAELFRGLADAGAGGAAGGVHFLQGFLGMARGLVYALLKSLSVN